MAEPFLHRAQVDTVPQRPCSVRGSELVKPEVFRLEPSPLRYGLRAIQEIELRPAARCREDQLAGFVGKILGLEVLWFWKFCRYG